MSTNILSSLYNTIIARSTSDAATSYTASLFAKGPKRIAQKVGEEAIEMALASLSGERAEVISESADLLFHMLVLWATHDVTPEDVMTELERREGMSGLQEKARRK